MSTSERRVRLTGQRWEISRRRARCSSSRGPLMETTLSIRSIRPVSVVRDIDYLGTGVLVGRPTPRRPPLLLLGWLAVGVNVLTRAVAAESIEYDLGLLRGPAQKAAGVSLAALPLF
jgi:hypothetical protein